MVGRPPEQRQPQQLQQQLYRFYIRNLPDNITKEDIVRLISASSPETANGTAGTTTVIVRVETIGHTKRTTIKDKGRNSSINKAFALVSTSRSNLPLQKLQFQGHALTIQPAGGFGSSSWVKPKRSSNKNQAALRTLETPPAESSSSISNHGTTIITASNDIQEADLLVTGPTKKNSAPKETSGPSPHGHVDAGDEDHDRIIAPDNNVIVGVPRHGPTATTTTKSLNDLLADYGEYDPNWQSMRINNNNNNQDDDHDSLSSQPQPAVVPLLPPQPSPPSIQTNEICNCLGLLGKAPIHVNISTFGHVHGLPSEYYNDAEQIVYDCDDYPDVLSPCPTYLEFLDGQAMAVKRAMIHSPLRTLAKQTISMEIMERLEYAIQLHGYGYANPYQMTVYIGSTHGRHRSIVLAELVATAVRQRLRNADSIKIPCTVSVGCTHRDLQKKLPSHHQRNNEGKKKVQRYDDHDEDDVNEIKARRLSQRAGRW